MCVCARVCVHVCLPACVHVLMLFERGEGSNAISKTEVENI